MIYANSSYSNIKWEILVLDLMKWFGSILLFAFAHFVQNGSASPQLYCLDSGVE
jgi:hypothetical protein